MNNTSQQSGNEPQDFKIEIQNFGKYRGVVINSYKGPFGELSIPASFNGIPVMAIADFAFKGCSGLKSIVLPEGLVSIGDYAFEKCGIASITLPEGLVSIKKSVFAGCTRLTSITLPDTLTSIGKSAFSGCNGLTSITLPVGLTSIGERAFDGCNKLTDFIVDEQNQSYSSIGGVLFDKAGTVLVWYPKGRQDKSYTIPDGVTHIEDWAFEGCIVIRSITLPNSLTSIGNYVFTKCGLANISLPDGLTSIGNSAFKMCNRFTSITLPQTLISLGEYAFAECSNLEKVVISRKTKIGSGAFYHVPGERTYRS
jgi:hypothetical protein